MKNDGGSQEMRYNKLEQPRYLTELDPKYAQMIFKAKLEMFEMFKGLSKSKVQYISSDLEPIRLTTTIYEEF